MTRKAHNVDRQRTKEAHFLDPGSYWTHDGHEFLFGADLERRRREVFDRDEGRCTGCRKPVWLTYGHMHHVKHRGRGGSDDLENLAWSCWECHAKEHVRVLSGKNDPSV